MSEELKPCPFCGCEKIEIIQHFHPRCTRCGCIQESVIGCEAVPKWNGRIYDRLEQENAELKSEVIRLKSGLFMIESPILYLQNQAERTGNDFNGAAAVSLSNDPEFLKDIARQILNK